MNAAYVIACMHTYIHTHIHTYTHTHIHTYTHTNIHTHIHTYIHTHIHTYIHTCTHTYIHTHTHIHTYTHTYTHTQEEHLALAVCHDILTRGTCDTNTCECAGPRCWLALIVFSFFSSYFFLFSLHSVLVADLRSYFSPSFSYHRLVLIFCFLSIIDLRSWVR